MRFLVALLCFSLTLDSALAQRKDSVKVKGRVLLDVNNDGKVDAGDKGLAGVLVTDGVQFVKTAADGSYELTVADDPVLPYRPAQVISVSWPSGTWPVKHQWWARLSNIEPGQSVDFLLRDDKQKLPFTVAQGTDPHNDLSGSETFRDDIARMDRNVNFCIMTGDLGYMGRETADKSFTSIRNFTLGFPVPMMHAPGNHDICDIHSPKWSEPDPQAGYNPYTKHLGPLRYSFNYAGTHFVGLDWARVMPDGKLQTGVPDIVIDWLAKDLAQLPEGTRIFAYMHHYHRHEDDKFWDLLVKHKVELVLAGHSHRNLDQSRRGVKALTTMNMCGPYRLLTVGEKGHLIVDRCFAGNGTEHAHSYAGQCKVVDWKTLKVARGAEKKEDAPIAVDSKAVKTGIPVDKNMEIALEIEPGSAKKYGLRLGPDSLSAAPFELSFSGEELRCGDVVTAAVNGRGQKTTLVRVIVEGGLARVYANNRVRFELPFDPPEGSILMLFADDGQARFTVATTPVTKVEEKKK